MKAATNKKLKQMSKGHDTPILNWKQKVEARANSVIQTCKKIPQGKIFLIR